MSRYQGNYVSTYENLNREEKRELLTELKIAVEIDEYHFEMEKTKAVRDKLHLSDRIRFIKGMKGKESEDDGEVVGLLLDKVMVVSSGGQKHTLSYSKVIL